MKYLGCPEDWSSAAKDDGGNVDWDGVEIQILGHLTRICSGAMPRIYIKERGKQISWLFSKATEHPFFWLIHIAADLSSHWIKTAVTVKPNRECSQMLNKIQFDLVIVYFALSFINLLELCTNSTPAQGRWWLPESARSWGPGRSPGPEPASSRRSRYRRWVHSWRRGFICAFVAFTD